MSKIYSSPPCGLTPPPVGSSITKEGRKAASMAVDIRLATFYEKNIEVFTDNEIKYVALNSICKNIGLSWGTQYKKLMKDPTLNKAVKKKYNIVEGKRREIICIPLDMLQGWLFHINENKVKPEIKEIVMLYKKECYEVLDNYFNRGYALNEEILINKPQLREQLVEEIQSLESGFIDINVQEGDIEASYKFIVATRSDGTKVTIHNIKSLLNIIISSGGTTLSEKTLVNKLGLRFPPGHKYRVIARMKGQKGQIPLMIKSEGIVEFLKDNNITVDRDLLVLLINELNDQLKVRRECGDPVFSSGFGDSLVTRTDIVFNYLLESFSRDTGESFLELSDVVYVAELKNGNYYIGALAEQTFKERFLGHDLIKEKNFKSFVALFIPKHKRQSINCFSVEAELHSLISQYTDQRLSAIRSSGSSGFKASPSIIFRALYHSQTLKEFVLIDKEILEGAENYLIGLIK